MRTAPQHNTPLVAQALARDVLPCRTCLLNDPSQAWLIQAGRADVFAVRVEDGVGEDEVVGQIKIDSDLY